MQSTLYHVQAFQDLRRKTLALLFLSESPTDLPYRHNSSSLNTLPNPYHMPNTPYSIDFDDTGPLLNWYDTRTLLRYIRRYYIKYIREHDAGNKPLEAKELHHENIAFSILYLKDPGLTWTSAVDIVDAFSAKSNTDGAHELWARVFRKKDGEEVASAAIQARSAGLKGAPILRSIAVRNVTEVV